MRKDDFKMKCIVVAAIFVDSVSGVILVVVYKINKMADRLGVNEFGFCWISSTRVILVVVYKINKMADRLGVNEFGFCWISSTRVAI